MKFLSRFLLLPAILGAVTNTCLAQEPPELLSVRGKTGMFLKTEKDSVNTRLLVLRKQGKEMLPVAIVLVTEIGEKYGHVKIIEEITRSFLLKKDLLVSENQRENFPVPSPGSTQKAPGKLEESRRRFSQNKREPSRESWYLMIGLGASSIRYNEQAERVFRAVRRVPILHMPASIWNYWRFTRQSAMADCSAFS